jgi:hypothetical protein
MCTCALMALLTQSRAFFARVLMLTFNSDASRGKPWRKRTTDHDAQKRTCFDAHARGPVNIRYGASCPFKRGPTLAIHKWFFQIRDGGHVTLILSHPRMTKMHVYVNSRTC